MKRYSIRGDQLIASLAIGGLAGLAFGIYQAVELIWEHVAVEQLPAPKGDTRLAVDTDSAEDEEKGTPAVGEDEDDPPLAIHAKGRH